MVCSLGWLHIAQSYPPSIPFLPLPVHEHIQSKAQKTAKTLQKNYWAYVLISPKIVLNLLFICCRLLCDSVGKGTPLFPCRHFFLPFVTSSTTFEGQPLSLHCISACKIISYSYFYHCLLLFFQGFSDPGPVSSALQCQISQSHIVSTVLLVKKDWMGIALMPVQKGLIGQ